MNKYSEELRHRATNLSLSSMSDILNKDVYDGKRHEFFEQALAVTQDLYHDEYDAYCETLALFLAEMSQYDIDIFLATFKY